MVTRRLAALRERGYNLVFLICFVTLLSVVLTAVLPEFGTFVKRQKEAELIFRGTQIAEGIRVFQQRFGRYPASLEEMVEVQPRALRQLWRDPMTDDGRWAFILAAASGQATPDDDDGQGGEDGGEADGTGVEVGGGSAPQPSFRLRQGEFGGAQARGPIVGVVSRSKDSSLRVFMGKEQYSEWRFTVSMLPKPAVVPGSNVVTSANVERLGVPFPPGLEPRQGGAPGGQPGSPESGSAPRDMFDNEDDEDGG